MQDESTATGRVQTGETKSPTPPFDDNHVLRVMREPLRSDHPVVRFAPQTKRYLGLFH